MNAVVKQKIESFYANNKAGVDELASYINVPPLWLVALFYNESGLNPSITNSIGAVGLNQMMPATLAGLGITPAQYKAGGVTYQLQVMQRHFRPVKGKIKRAGDLYLFNFLPAAVIENVPVDFILGQAGSTERYKGLSKNLIYIQNKSLDYNNSGTITRRDFWEGFEAKYDEVVKLPDSSTFFFRDAAIDIKTHWALWLVVLALLIVIVVMIYKTIL